MYTESQPVYEWQKDPKKVQMVGLATIITVAVVSYALGRRGGKRRYPFSS